MLCTLNMWGSKNRQCPCLSSDLGVELGIVLIMELGIGLGLGLGFVVAFSCA